MQNLEALGRPIAFDELKSGVPKRLQAHLERLLAGGGLLPPRTLGAFVDRIMELDPSVGGRLTRFRRTAGKLCGALNHARSRTSHFKRKRSGLR
jgi:hypothetical protein